MRKGVLRYTAAIIGFLALVLGIMLLCLNTVAFNLGTYTALYEELDRYNATGMEAAELERVTQHTLDYMRGKEPEFNMFGMINGETRQVFSDRETQHMVDVQALFILERTVMWISLIAGAALIAVSIIGRMRKRLRFLAKSYMIGAGAFVALLGVIFILISSDFGAFWTQFHGIFFTNDLWILDPAQDMLIVMFPEQFFLSICLRIFISFGVIVVIGYVLSLLCLYLGRSRARKGVLL